MKHFFVAAVVAAIVVCWGGVGATAADLAGASKAEIDFLLAAMKNSGCQFNRNGQWYGADEAVSHIETKYSYLLRKHMLSSTEDFIDRAATGSSMSGQAYLVRCGDAAPVESSVWFKAELARYRSGKGAGSP